MNSKLGMAVCSGVFAALSHFSLAGAQDISGNLTCDKTKIPLTDTVAYVNDKAEFFGRKQWSVRVHVFKTKLTAEEKQWWAARDAMRKKPDGVYMGAEDFGYKGAILKDFKRQNEIQNAIALRFNIDLKDGLTPATLEQKGLDNAKIAMFTSVDCGGAHRNNTFPRSPGNPDKVSQDFQGFSAELKEGGKGTLASKRAIPADTTGKAQPKINIDWDIKGKFSVLKLPG